jgi:formylglycine-generating enzyme required for sulfatase activity
MKSTWLTVWVVAAVAFLPLTHAKPDEPGKAPTPVADPMRGKEAGDVRDDNGLKMKLVWCPGGEFTMGKPESEGDQGDAERFVDVTLANGFWMGKYEVTQSEWKQVLATEAWKDKDLTMRGADFPATFVDWDDVNAFCRKLTARERAAKRLPAGWEYKLPNEVQWERACRAGTKTDFSFGDAASNLGEYAWFSKNAWNTDEPYAHRVGQKRPNPWGLHDMHGNVLEWCQKSSPAKIWGFMGTFRGGCWLSTASYCESSGRVWYGWPDRNAYTGFRVALAPVEQTVAGLEPGPSGLKARGKSTIYK